MGVLVLAETGVSRGNPDVAGETELVREVPGVAMGDDDQRLGEPSPAFAKGSMTSLPVTPRPAAAP